MLAQDLNCVYVQVIPLLVLCFWALLMGQEQLDANLKTYYNLARGLFREIRTLNVKNAERIKQISFKINS
jgi:hypothetical protein